MPSTDDFDFWVGTWNVSWGESERETGRNVVTRSFGGNVIEEQFDGRPGIDLIGMSMSVFDGNGELWRQTWVDDAGNYFALEGNLTEAGMELLCRTHNGPPGATYRMRWFDVEPDSLTWTWERSLDGEAFEELWRLHYERA